MTATDLENSSIFTPIIWYYMSILSDEITFYIDLNYLTNYAQKGHEWNRKFFTVVVVDLVSTVLIYLAVSGIYIYYLYEFECWEWLTKPPSHLLQMIQASVVPILEDGSQFCNDIRSHISGDSTNRQRRDVVNLLSSHSHYVIWSEELEPTVLPIV